MSHADDPHSSADPINDTAVPNPFRDRQSPTILNTAEPLLSNKRPRGLNVVAILSLIGGILGFLLGLVGLAQFVIGSQMGSGFTVGTGQFAEAQQQMYEQVQQLNSKFLPLNATVAVVSMFASIALIIGGMGLLFDQPFSRRWLSRTFVASMIIELASIVVFAIVQWRMFPIMQSYVQRISAAPTGAPGASSEVIAAITQISAWATIVVYVIWVLFKLGLLRWGYVFLSQPHLVEYFRQVEPKTAVEP